MSDDENRFILQLGNIPVFKKMFTGVYNVFPQEAIFNITKDGLIVQDFMPGKVSAVSAKLSPEIFVQYDVREDTKINVHMDEMKKVVQNLRDDSLMLIRMRNDENLLYIYIKGKTIQTFKLNVSGVSEEDIKYPSLTYKNKIMMKSHYFSKAIKDAEIFSNDVLLSIQDNYFIIESVGNMGSTQTIIDLKEDDVVIGTDVKQGSRASYDAKNFIDYFIRMADKDTNMLIKFDTDYPITMRFYLDKDNDEAYIEYMLAPRREPNYSPDTNI